MVNIQSVRGTRDIVLPEIAYWQYMEQIIRDSLTKATYQEIRTPIFEQTHLFERSIGEVTDVVSKEMYTFIDKGNRSLTLRPEGTASVIRAYIERKLFAQGGLHRLWYIGPMFRYERPQAGRQRQFHQAGVEVVGSSDPRADVEVIAIATEICHKLGLQNLSLQINSVGTNEDRQNYRKALVQYLTPFKEELDIDSQVRLKQNPLRILDSKNQKTQEIVKTGPSILNYLSDESKSHFDQVLHSLSKLDIDYQLNPYLVRGLDYYNHTAFEIQSSDLEAQATICGGGRYDGLVTQLGGPQTPAVGWAIGLERLVLLLQQLHPLPQTPLDFYFVSKGKEAEAQSSVIAHHLRLAGFAIEVNLKANSFSKQLKLANRSGAIACLILGENEAQQKMINIKWLHNKTQETVEQSSFLNNLEYWKQQISKVRKEIRLVLK